MKTFDNGSNVFQLLSEAISDGIVIVDTKQEIVATNKATNTLFGYEESELVGQHLDVLIPKKYLPQHEKHVDKFVQKSEKRQMGHGRNLFGLKKNGDVFPVEAGLNPFFIAGQKYVMALVIDITHRLAQQERIERLNTQLELKIAERTQTLEETVASLKQEVELRREAEMMAQESLKKERELNELKTKFLSLVSHEFKTPLSGILSSSSLIARYDKEEHQPKREKHLNTIKSKVKYLDNILNDFLSIERLETGKVNYKYNRFPLSKVVNEVIYDANMLLKEGQHINYPKDLDHYELHFDERALELILSNLVSNAIKYSPEGSVINVQIDSQEEWLVIAVTDQGIGIPEEEQKHIFKRYFRAANVLTSQGTGIGLNISQTHLKNLGGNLRFESQENKGTTFYLELPKSIVIENE